MSSEWFETTLAEFANINPKRPIVKGSNAPFIEMAALPTHARDIPFEDVAERVFTGGGSKFANGDTLLARITPCLENGKTARVSCLAHDVCGHGSTEFIVLAPRLQSDEDFLYYLARSDEFRTHAISRMEGTSGRQRVPNAAVGQYAFLCPPANERKEIGDLLSSLDGRISLLRETNTTLEAIAQALFKSWFVDFDPVRAKQQGSAPQGMDAATAALFPDSFEASELGEVPKGWRVGTLGDLTEFQNGYAFKSKDWVDSGHPVVKIGDVKPGIIDLAGCSFVAPAKTVGLERFRLERGDLLVGMTGYVGETGLVSAVEPSAYLNQRVGRFSTPQGFAGLGYVYCLVRNQAFKSFAEAQSHGSAQANVSGAALLTYSCVMPTTAVMEQFNETVHALLKSILSNHEQAQTLATLRETLLPRLISGQLRLPESV